MDIDTAEQAIKVNVLYSYLAAKKAHETIFRDRPDKSVAIGYLNSALSYSKTAYAIYVCHLDRLEHVELDDYFHELQTFVEEALECYRTDHSHQWTDIHFNRLEEKYNRIKSIVGIEG